MTIFSAELTNTLNARHAAATAAAQSMFEESANLNRQAKKLESKVRKMPYSQERIDLTTQAARLRHQARTMYNTATAQVDSHVWKDGTLTIIGSGA